VLRRLDLLQKENPLISHFQHQTPIQIYIKDHKEVSQIIFQRQDQSLQRQVMYNQRFLAFLLLLDMQLIFNIYELMDLNQYLALF